MEEGADFSFDDFSVEMQDFEVRKVRKYDRIWHIGPGGSISSGIVAEYGRIYFGSRDRFFYALDARTGELVWKFETSDSIGGGVPVVRDGVVYFGSRDRNFYALDAHTGELLWKFQAEGEIGCCGGCADDEMVYFGSRDNFVYALYRKTGDLAWRFKTRDCVVSMPVVHGNRLFIGSFDHNLYCIDKRTGEMEWKFATQGEIFNYTPFLVNEGMVHFGSFDNYLRAVDIETGELAWRFRTGFYGMSAGTVMYKGVLYQGCRDGILYALTPGGRMKWKFVTKEIVIPVSCHDDRIYFGSGDQNLHCLDLQGKELWKYGVQGGVIGKIAVLDDRVYFGSYDCNLYVVDIKTHTLAWKFKAKGSPSYFPPPFDEFEVAMKTQMEPKPEEKKKTYELNLTEEPHEMGGFYKSKITYQVNIHYREKGKYQVEDSDDTVSFRVVRRRSGHPRGRRCVFAGPAANLQRGSLASRPRLAVPPGD